MKVFRKWGVEGKEVETSFPCDDFVKEYDEVLWRGVTISSTPEIIFRWLCQLKVAPYSYDFLDNFGKGSPKELIPGIDDLEVGQEVMQIFSIIGFEGNRSITCRMKTNSLAFKIYGDCLGSYLIVPNQKYESRLLIKFFIKYPPGITGFFMKRILPLGDLIMMRKQLLTFKKLSESDYRRSK